MEGRGGQQPKKRRNHKPSTVPERVEQNTPLRLEIAAQIAFPGGGLSAASLRKERDNGNLVTEMIAGKEFTTLAEIAKMRAMPSAENATCLSKPARRTIAKGSSLRISPQAQG